MARIWNLAIIAFVAIIAIIVKRVQYPNEKWKNTLARAFKGKNSNEYKKSTIWLLWIIAGILSPWPILFLVVTFLGWVIITC